MKLTRENNPNWKGGRIITPHGYILIRVGINHHLADVRGYAYEHRLIIEKKLGRRLQDGEQVHHINGVREDNRSENLIVIRHADHKVLHRKKESKRRLPNEPNILIKCKCGCGVKLKKYDCSGRPRKYVTGHYRKGYKKYPKGENPIIECACGCGSTFNKYDKSCRSRKYISGHNPKGRRGKYE